MKTNNLRCPFPDHKKVLMKTSRKYVQSSMFWHNKAPKDNKHSNEITRS